MACTLSRERGRRGDRKKGRQKGGRSEGAQERNADPKHYFLLCLPKEGHKIHGIRAREAQSTAMRSMAAPPGEVRDLRQR